MIAQFGYFELSDCHTATPAFAVLGRIFWQKDLLLGRPLENSGHYIFWEGHDFSRAIKPFILVIPNRLSAGEESAFRSFSAVS